MDSDRLGAIRHLLPKLPLAMRVALLHTLHISQQSKYLDLRTELAVAIVRSFATDPKPRSVSSVQRFFLRETEIKGRLWVAKYTAPAPPDGVRDALVAAIDGLAPKAEVQLADVLPKPPAATAASQAPAIVPVEAEWTGYRADATPTSTLPPISEAEKYGEMMKEVKSPVTVLYFHGGAYWLMDPASHRPNTKKLAKLTGGRCYSVRYRLAPQNPFPAALLDALVSYLTLLRPPPGAFHEAVSPAHIVICGDSAGGNLCLALTQTILELRRQGRKVNWLGEEMDVPLPSGVAVCSPWMDITMTSPSWEANEKWDYLPTPSAGGPEGRPPCKAWPADPPRVDLYAHDDRLLHPLVSLVAAPARCWEGCPPVFICTGWELLADEDKYMAARLAAAGVPVVFEEYEAMPHCFAMIFTHLEASRRCMRSWAGFITKVSTSEDGEKPASSAVESRFTLIKAKSLQEVRLTPDAVSPCSEEEMKNRLGKRVALLLSGASPMAGATPKL